MRGVQPAFFMGKRHGNGAVRSQGHALWGRERDLRKSGGGFKTGLRFSRRGCIITNPRVGTYRIRLSPCAVFLCEQTLGLAIVGLEFGFLCVCRAGWKISTGNLTASITLSCVLLAVGVLLYGETLTLRQITGMAVCGLGLFLMTK